MPLPVGYDGVGENDDDFQSLTPINYLTQTSVRTKSVRRNGTSSSQRLPLKSCNEGAQKRRKRVLEIVSGKENDLSCGDKILDGQRSADCVDLGEDFSDVEIRLHSYESCSLGFVDSSPVYPSFEHQRDEDCFSFSNATKSEIDSTWLKTRAVETCRLSVVESTLDPEASICKEEEVGYWKQDVRCTDSHLFNNGMELKAVKYGVVGNCRQGFEESSLGQDGTVCERKIVLEKEPLKCKQSYLCNSIESRLVNAPNNFVVGISCSNLAEAEFEEFEPGTQLNELLRLCSDERQIHYPSTGDDVNIDDLVCCPLCACDLSELNEETRLVHTNECLDKMETENVSTR